MELQAVEIHLKDFLKNLWRKSHYTIIDGFWLCVTVVVFLTAQPSNTSLMVGAIFSLLGESIRVWVNGYPRRIKDFYIAGPYRFLRHPRFLGSFLIFLGLVIAGGNTLVLWLYVLTSTGVVLLLCEREEKKLFKLAGQKFVHYRQGVLAFVPQFFAYETYNPNQYRFSFNYGFFSRKRRELDSTLGLVVAYLLLFGLMYVTQKWVVNVFLAGLLMIFILLRTRFYRATFSKGMTK